MAADGAQALFNELVDKNVYFIQTSSISQLSRGQAIIPIVSGHGLMFAMPIVKKCEIK